MKNKLLRRVLYGLGPAIILWILIFAGARSIFGQQPPAMTQDRLFSMLGRAQAQIELQSEYIQQLQARIAELEKQQQVKP